MRNTAVFDESQNVEIQTVYGKLTVTLDFTLLEQVDIGLMILKLVFQQSFHRKYSEPSASRTNILLLVSN